MIDNKKFIVAACMAFIGLGITFAQEGRQAIGFNLNYGTEVENLGIGVKYQYNITDELRIEPSFNYYFENDNRSMRDINVNAHYLFFMNRGLRLYPLFGFTYTNWHWDLGEANGYDISGNKRKFGVNLGGGAEFPLADEWALNFEIKYQLINKCDQCVFNVGVTYEF